MKLKQTLNLYRYINAKLFTPSIYCLRPPSRNRIYKHRIQSTVVSLPFRLHRTNNICMSFILQYIINRIDTTDTDTVKQISSYTYCLRVSYIKITYYLSNSTHTIRMFTIYNFVVGPVMAHSFKCVYKQVVVSITTQGNDIFYIVSSSLCYRGKACRCLQLQNSIEEERNILTVGSGVPSNYPTI